jgi:hypothetical protein
VCCSSVCVKVLHGVVCRSPAECLKSLLAAMVCVWAINWFTVCPGLETQQGVTHAPHIHTRLEHTCPSVFDILTSQLHLQQQTTCFACCCLQAC